MKRSVLLAVLLSGLGLCLKLAGEKGRDPRKQELHWGAAGEVGGKGRFRGWFGVSLTSGAVVPSLRENQNKSGE